MTDLKSAAATRQHSPPSANDKILALYLSSGNGEGYSKIRISVYLEYHPGNIWDYVFEVRYENF